MCKHKTNPKRQTMTKWHVLFFYFSFLISHQYNGTPHWSQEHGCPQTLVRPEFHAHWEENLCAGHTLKATYGAAAAAAVLTTAAAALPTTPASNLAVSLLLPSRLCLVNSLWYEPEYARDFGVDLYGPRASFLGIFFAAASGAASGAASLGSFLVLPAALFFFFGSGQCLPIWTRSVKCGRKLC